MVAFQGGGGSDTPELQLAEKNVQGLHWTLISIQYSVISKTIVNKLMCTLLTLATCTLL